MNENITNAMDKLCQFSEDELWTYLTDQCRHVSLAFDKHYHHGWQLHATMFEESIAIGEPGQSRKECLVKACLRLREEKIINQRKLDYYSGGGMGTSVDMNPLTVDEAITQAIAIRKVQEDQRNRLSENPVTITVEEEGTFDKETNE